MSILTILAVAVIVTLSLYLQRRSQQKLLSEVTKRFELVGEQMAKFTTDVVDCLSNNFDGFAAKLDGKPCKSHESSIEELKRKYANHEDRIGILEEKVKKLEGGS